ncbi:MAG TPA: MFS transporter [Burkholderiales bacterium]|nr:MFS transporter [Burkholderiales bacterium]
MKDRSALICQAFSNVGHSYAHIMTLLYPTVVLALEVETGMSYAELIVLMTAGNVLFGVGALPAGWLGDRWSTLGMMVVFFIGTGCASILTGTMSTPFGIALGLALIGLFASIYHPVGMAWIAQTAVNRGRALGVNGMFGSLGVASAALIAGVLTGLFGWRAAFFVPGLVSVITGVALLYLMRSGAVREHAVETTFRPAPQRDARVRAFMILSLTMLCSGLIFQAASTALPKVYAEQVPELTGGTAAGAGVLVSAVYFLGIGAQFVGGHLADRYAMRGVYGLLYVAQVPLLLAAAVLAGVPLFMLSALAVLLNTTAVPVENSLLSHYAPEKWRGTAFGAKFMLALGVGALAVPVVALLHAATGGFGAFFILLGVLALIIVAGSLMLPVDSASQPSVKAEA